AAERAAQGVKAAKARIRSIEREHAALAAELDAGDKFVVETADAYAKAVQAQNQRSRALAKGHAEVLALAARFSIDGPTLPRVLAPDQREASSAARDCLASVWFAQAEPIKPVVEED